MNTPSINAVVLPAAIVNQALETWLNANLFRAPHTVTSVDCDGETYSVGVTPTITELTPAGWQSITSETLAVRLAEAPLNGNGHRAESEEAAPAPAAEESKRSGKGGKRVIVTAEQKAEAVRQHAAGLKTTRIAANLGLGLSTVARILRANPAAAPAADGEE